MLAQVLNRDFMLGTAEATERQLRTIVDNRRAGFFGREEDPDEIPTSELIEAADELAAVLAATGQDEAAGEGGPLSTEPDREDDKPAPPPKDDYAYIPRDPTLGLMQSALDEFATDSGLVEEEEMADDRRSGPLPIVTDRRIEGVELTLTDERRVWRRMEVAHPLILSDPGWVRSLITKRKARQRGRAPFVDRPGAPPPLAESARVILVGDWGSGLKRAKTVGTKIQEQLNDPTAERRQKHVIHLGDVYYGGEVKEYKENFLAPWPVDPGAPSVASYTLNGNHDMFEGGHAYFGTALADPRFAAQGGSSTFALANDHWQFLGLDTAYEDEGLHGSQAAWVKQMRSDHPDRKTVLLSHHQLFSPYEEGAAGLRKAISPVLEEKPLEAWFWGHEHRCLVCRDYQNVRFASCVGHGGIPEYLAKQQIPPTWFRYEYRKKHGRWQPFNTFGFAVLDVDGPHIAVRYIDEHGTEHWTETLA